jgi:nucleoside-diphosphate-sugar epimerase
MGHEVVPISGQLLVAHQHERCASLESAMQGVDAVVHLAARAHVIREDHSDPEGEYRRANVALTQAVAQAAIAARVRRLVYVSSIGVLGHSSGNRAFGEADAPAPIGPYARSKWDAEQALRELERAHPLQLVVVRPPLVYGPGVKGNFLRLLKLVASGIPLPLGSVRNQRSYVGLDNLCDFLVLCAFHPDAAGRLLLVADGEDIATAELLHVLAAGMGKRSRVFRCPELLLSTAATLLGRQEDWRKLASSLRVDATTARVALGWTPKKSLHAGMMEMVRWFMSECRP